MSETSDDAAVERFATLLEETGTGRHRRRPDDADPELVGLVELTRRLAAPLAPRPELRAELLDRIMTAFEEQQRPAEPALPVPAARDEQAVSWPVNGRGTVAPRPRRGVDDALPELAATEPAGSLRQQRERQLANAKTQFVRVVRAGLGRRARLAAVLGVAVGALVISGVSMASGNAMPGDPLYRVKSFGEQAQLLFAGSDADRGHLHLDFARIRLVEARQVDPESVAGVLAAMDREATEGARLLFTAGFSGAGAEIDLVTDFVQQQRAALLALRDSAPAAATAAQRSLDLLTAIEIRANELRAAIADGCSTTATDQFGPDPTC